MKELKRVLHDSGSGGYSLIRAKWDVRPVRVCFPGIFCLKQGIDFYHFVLNRVSFLGKFLTQGIVLG